MALTEADFMSALHSYISAVTGLDGKRIFRGNQSRMVLPKSGAYCIYTPILRRRVGTNRYTYNAEGCDDNTNGTDTITALVLIDVQVDFYDAGAAAYAQALEIASRSYIGSEHFKANNYDVRVVTAQNPKNLTGIDSSNQYEERWMVQITGEVNAIIANGLPWFEDFHFRRAAWITPPGGDKPEKVYKYGIANVDVEYPPTEKEDENE